LVKAKDHLRAKSALQQIGDDLPQSTINKGINDFLKRWNVCVSADGEHFDYMMLTVWLHLITVHSVA